MLKMYMYGFDLSSGFKLGSSDGPRIVADTMNNKHLGAFLVFRQTNESNFLLNEVEL